MANGLSENKDSDRDGKAVLITGASGFIGNYLTDEAIDRGYNVFVTVRRSTNTVRLREKKVNIVQTDLSDPADTSRKIAELPRFTFIIHNAGVTKTNRKKEFFEVNHGNTQRLILALKNQHKVPDKFLYVSSLAAYGPGDKNSSDPVGLHSKPNPVTLYGKSKLAAEKYIIETSGIPYLIFRPTAVYGPGDKDFLQTIKLIRIGFDFQIGTKSQNLTFIYVKDLARLLYDAAGSSLYNKSYFVSDGHLYNSRDLGRIVSHYLGRKAKHIAVPAGLAKVIAGFAETYGKLTGKPSVLNMDKIPELAALNWNCDVQPLVDDFDFKALYDLDNGMKETVAWYRKMGWISQS